MIRYLVLGSKPWNATIFETVIRHYPGKWTYISNPEAVTIAVLRDLNPRYLFFLHWSWKVPPEIVKEFECINFHMTDLPYGRGGSPLQNLIARGHRETWLTAFRMTNEMDAGPVYLKRPLSLEGSAEEIYQRASRLAAKMIHMIIPVNLPPLPQVGQPAVFHRRTPAESVIGPKPDLLALHDHIRMLDAATYPPAFLVHEGFRYTFSRATLRDGYLVADVTITKERECES